MFVLNERSPDQVHNEFIARAGERLRERSERERESAKFKGNLAINIDGALGTSRLSVTINFEGFGRRVLNGDIGGTGFSGIGNWWGMAWFEVAPEELNDQSEFLLLVTALYAEITFYNAGTRRYQGVALAGGIGGAAWIGGGKGLWLPAADGAHPSFNRDRPVTVYPLKELDWTRAKGMESSPQWHEEPSEDCCSFQQYCTQTAA